MAKLPQSADTIKQMFQEAGINEYEPQLLVQMYDIAYAITKQVLVEARSISEFSGKKQVEKSDVDFALKAFNEKYAKDRPPTSLMAELAAEKNAQPLPQIRQNYGLRLPNDRFCQLQQNYAYIDERQQSTPNIDEEIQRVPQPNHSQQQSQSKQQINTSINSFNPELVSNMLMGRPDSSRKRPYPGDATKSEQADAEDDYD